MHALTADADLDELRFAKPVKESENHIIGEVLLLYLRII
jgi:hypothetical protein